jgi:hypothetical protein
MYQLADTEELCLVIVEDIHFLRINVTVLLQ